ncbi:MAG: hypothetical protein N4A70_17870 [Pelagimonas sp.]|jgi:hypothetical protein|nr:hypothetical protein [Pelagimonas sp.]
MDVTECVNAAFPLPAFLFSAGAISVALYLKHKHQLSYVQTFMAMVGARRVKHDRVSSVMILLTLIVPLVLWVQLGARCS